MVEVSAESKIMNSDNIEDVRPELKNHYLQKELYALIREDRRIFDFLSNSSLDGIWYWDLEDPDHEWMSPKFWELFGYDAASKKHLASEWQDIIFPEDLKKALDNFNRHCADTDYPYDQIVRYTHRAAPLSGFAAEDLLFGMSPVNLFVC